jgi:pyrroloquinoline quinone biosynthesis protein D
MGSSVLKLSPADRPRLAAGCRLCLDEARSSGCLYQDNEEGLSLNDSAIEILSRCTGERNIDTLIREMVALYAGSDEAEIAAGVREFLEEAYLRGWIDRSADLG